MLNFSYIGRDNYSSAKGFSAQVQKTFVEEVALGMVEGPFSSEVNTWLGFQVNPCVPIVDFPIGKKTILGALLQCIMDGQPFSCKDIEKALKRLSWATSARPLSRPFLYTSGRPSKLI
jgi:hypothetical protein